MLAERARGLLSGEVSRPDEHETRRQLEFANTAVPWFSFQREIVDRAVLNLKDAGVPSFLIE
jgi:hypothetical protein